MNEAVLRVRHNGSGEPGYQKGRPHEAATAEPPSLVSPRRRSRPNRSSRRLLGLKENIIIGHPIPAGTAQYRYQEVEIEGMEMPVVEEPLPGSLDPLPNVFSPSFAETGFSLGGPDE